MLDRAWSCVVGRSWSQGLNPLRATDAPPMRVDACRCCHYGPPMINTAKHSALYIYVVVSNTIYIVLQQFVAYRLNFNYQFANPTYEL